MLNQEYVLSPTLLNLVVEEVVVKNKHELLVYADNLVYLDY